MTIQKLIARLEGAERPDRDIDVAIIQAVFRGLENAPRIALGDEPIFWHDPFRKLACPRLTESVDAAIALAEKVLPGWWLHGLGKSPLHGLWWCQLYSLDERKSVEVEEINTAAIAIVLATLQALRALSKQGDRTE